MTVALRCVVRPPVAGTLLRRFGHYRRRRPRTEHRAADPHVCRAGFDGGLEVAAHARRDPRRRGVDERARRRPPRPAARTPSPGPRPAARRHHAAQPQPLGLDDPLDQGGHVGRVAARPARSASGRVEAHLHQARRGRARAPGRPRLRPRTSLAPVDGLHHVGVRRDRGGLVALQAADEVPRAGRGRRTRPPWRRPPGGGSPRRARTPSSASRRTSEAGKNLVTTISVTSSGSRPARGAGRVDPVADARPGRGSISSRRSLMAAS